VKTGAYFCTHFYNLIEITIKYGLITIRLIFIGTPDLIYTKSREGGIIMSEIEEILAQIEDLRKNLNTLIKEKDTLLDPKVIVASQMLDSMLNEYDKIVKKSDK